MAKKTSSRTYAGLSESERIQERKERFLEAGLEVFGTVGLRGAKVRLLCKAAGLTERYFYESFTDTESLFLAVYEKQSSELLQHFLTRLPQIEGSLDERIDAALTLFFQQMRDPRRVRVLHIESMVGGTKIFEQHFNYIRNAGKMAATLIRTDNPDLKQTDAVIESVALAINHSISMLASQWMLEDFVTPIETLVNSAGIVIRGTMRELSSQ